jgi:hypothetical protein
MPLLGKYWAENTKVKAGSEKSPLRSGNCRGQIKRVLIDNSLIQAHHAFATLKFSMCLTLLEETS